MNQPLQQYFNQQQELGYQTVYTHPIPEAPGQASAESLLRDLQAKGEKCKACGLAATRNRFVFGKGSPTARLMFIGEAPGAEEDRLGLPFVGKAGALFNNMIEKGMTLTPESVYIANILKCRPPGNRDPQTGEISACTILLKEQIKIIKPEFICCLGRFAGRFLLGMDEDTTLRSMRGRFYDYMGVKVCVTYHPSALLQHPDWKRPAWEDLKNLMQAMGLAIPDQFK